MAPDNPAMPQYNKGKRYEPICYYCRASVNGQPDLQIERLEGRLTFLEETDRPDQQVTRKEHNELLGKVNYLQNKIIELKPKKKTDKF